MATYKKPGAINTIWYLRASVYDEGSLVTDKNYVLIKWKHEFDILYNKPIDTSDIFDAPLLTRLKLLKNLI